MGTMGIRQQSGNMLSILKKTLGVGEYDEGGEGGSGIVANLMCYLLALLRISVRSMDDIL